MMYIAYKLDTNFTDIVVKDDGLTLYINLHIDEVNDPKHICRDVSTKEHWGNGEIQVDVYHSDEIDVAMDIIQQAFDKQNVE